MYSEAAYKTLDHIGVVSVGRGSIIVGSEIVARSLYRLYVAFGFQRRTLEDCPEKYVII